MRWRSSRGFQPRCTHDLSVSQTIVAVQRQIAILAYGGRFGNGGVVSGDGWRYRGHGLNLKQITSKDNYRACCTALGLDLVSHPEWLERDGLAARSAG